MSKFNLIHTIFFFFLAATLHGQPEITGVIRVQNSKVLSGKTEYIPLAAVSADYCNPTTSGSDGKFRISFERKHSKKPINIQIVKRGLEVVNSDVLSTFIPASGQLDELNIYMCPQGELASAILKFRGIAEEEITRTYQLKIEELKRKNSLNAVTQLRLQDERDVALKKYKDLARVLAIVNLDDESSVYQEAYQLFEAGKIEAARTLIREADLERQLASLRKSQTLGNTLVAQSTKGIVEIANTYVLDAQMALAGLKYDEAFAAYDKAIQATDSTIIEHNIEAAELLGAQGQFTPSIKLLNKSLQLAEGNQLLEAYLQYYLGSMYLSVNQLSESEAMLLASLSTYTKLAEEQVSNKNLAAFTGILQIALASAYVFLGDREKQKSYAFGAIETFTALEEFDQQRFYAYTIFAKSVASGFLSLAELNATMEQMTVLAKENPRSFNPMLTLLNAVWCLNYSTSGSLLTEPYEVRRFQDKLDSMLLLNFTLIEEELNHLEAGGNKFTSAIQFPNTLTKAEELLGDNDRRIGLLFSTTGFLPAVLAISGQRKDRQKQEALANRYFTVLQKTMAKCQEFMVINEKRYKAKYLELSTVMGAILGISTDFERSIRLLDSNYEEISTLGEVEPGAFIMLSAINRAMYYSAHAGYYLFNEKYYGDMTRTDLQLLARETTAVLSSFENNTMVALLINNLAEWEVCFEREYLPAFILQRALQETDNKLTLLEETNNVPEYLTAFKFKLGILERLNEVDFQLPDALRLLQEYDLLVEYYQNREYVDSFLYARSTQIDILEKIALNVASVAGDSVYAAEAGSNAFYLLFDQQFEQAEKESQLALQYRPEEHFVYTNLAVAHLGQGDFSRALRAYAGIYDLPDPQSDNGGTYREVFLADLDTLAANGILLEQSPEIRKILDKPDKRFPPALVSGLNSLKQAKNAMAKGDDQVALDTYLKLLSTPSFSEYFADDFPRIWENVTTLSRKLGDGFPSLGQTVTTEVLLVAVTDIQQRVEKEILYSTSIDVPLLQQQLLGGLYLQKLATLRGASPYTKDLEKVRQKLLNNYHYTQVLAGEYAAAATGLKSLYPAQKTSPWFVSRYIVYLWLAGEEQAAKLAFMEHREDRFYGPPYFKNLVDRMKHQVHLLHKSGMPPATTDKVQQWLQGL